MTTLSDLLSVMTPTERAQFDTIQSAVAAGLITPAERKAAITLAKTDKPAFAALVKTLRSRLAGSSKAGQKRRAETKATRLQ